MKRSSKYKLNKRDLVKGLLMAGLSSVLFFVNDSIAEGAMTFEGKKLLIVAVGGMVAYLIKNFFEGDKKQTTE